MKKAKQTYFNSLWLSDIDYASWLQRADKNTSFFCKLCKKERELGTMGEGALKSHVKGDKHTELVKAEKLKKQFFKPRHGDKETQSSSSSQPSQSPQESGEKEETEKETSAGQQNICKFVAKASSAEAEIRWTLFCVKYNFSDNSQDGFVPIVQKMFPDSKIAASLRLGPDKIGKVVKFGLYPYFKSLVLDKILKSPKFVVSFDESLNNVTQTTQMDINIRYFDFDLMKVDEIYWHSNFLGTAAAVDLLKSFEDALEKLDLTKMIQVGMDGPSVNWSFVEKLKSSRDKNELPGLIDVGSCNLHVVHGAFKTGVESTTWNVKPTLKGSFYLLHDAPSRRAIYVNLGGVKYPQFFCGSRWVEDKAVAERLVEIWPQMVKLIDYFGGLVPSKRPKCKSYTNVKDAAGDNLTVVKLQIFSYIASLFEPYLTFYQKDVPLFPFMYQDLKVMLKALLSVIVKPSLLKDTSTASKWLEIDLNNQDNFLKVEDIHLGFAAEEEIRKHLQKDTIKKKDILELRKQTQILVKRVISKIAERSPLSSVIVRNALVFHPRIMVTYTAEKLTRKFKSLTQKLLQLNIINFQVADKALVQYKLLLTKEVITSKEKFLKFQINEDRVDTFFFDELMVHKEYPELSNIIIIILILSCGQAFTERGFSMNKNILKDNMQDNTIVGRRFVKGYLTSNDVDPHTIPITSAMMTEVKKSNMRYELDREEKRKQNKSSEEDSQKQLLSSEIKCITEQCHMLTDTVYTLNNKFVKLADKAEKENDIKYLIEGNALKRKAIEKTDQLAALVRRKEELLAQRKKYN